MATEDPTPAVFVELMDGSWSFDCLEAVWAH